MKALANFIYRLPPFVVSIIIIFIIACITLTAAAQTGSDRLTAELVADGGLVYVEGSVFSDADGNCHRKASETGLKGIEVTLQQRHTSFTVVTDAQGNFTFTIPPGKYELAVGESTAATPSDCSAAGKRVHAPKNQKVTRVLVPMLVTDTFSEETDK